MASYLKDEPTVVLLKDADTDINLLSLKVEDVKDIKLGIKEDIKPSNHPQKINGNQSEEEAMLVDEVGEDQQTTEPDITVSDHSIPRVPTPIRIKDEPQEVIIIGSTPSPRFKSRLIMEVVVPTLAQVKKKNEIEEDYKKLAKLKNPKVKTKNQFVFNDDTIRNRLKPLGLDPFPITLDKASQDVMVSRDFMSSTFGGSMQATCLSISKRRIAIRGMNDFVYLHPDYHPMAPQVPGAPGLFYFTSGGGDWPGIQRVFTRIESNVWQFMGMFDVKACASLTKEEWATLTVKVQNTWGKEICRQAWGGDVRARIRGRIDLGREPTEEEVKEILKNKRYELTTPEQVVAAYACGDERLGVWTMKCVGYDSRFQLELVDKYPTWVPPQRNPRGGKKGKKASKGNGKKEKKTPIKKKKRVTPGFTESETDEDDDKPILDSDIEITSENEALTYNPRGTRSRPICL